MGCTAEEGGHKFPVSTPSGMSPMPDHHRQTFLLLISRLVCAALKLCSLSHVGAPHGLGQ